MAGVYHRVGGAGKGGAGLLTCLKTLAYTASAKGWNIAYSSNYNPETRGGLVEGTVVIAESDPIESPVIDSYSAALAFDLDGYNNYGPRIEPGGVILWDSSTFEDPPALPGVAAYGVPIFRIAEQAGAPRLSNMAMLGALNKVLGLFTIEDMIRGMEEFLPVWRHKLIPYNKKVLEAVEQLDIESYRIEPAGV